MNTTNNPNIRSPWLAISLVVSLTIGVGLGFLSPMIMEFFLTQVSLRGKEITLYVANFLPPLFYGILPFSSYPFFVSRYQGRFKDKIKRYLPLLGAILLIFAASEMFSLYRDTFEIFHTAKDHRLTSEEENVRSRITGTLDTLRFIVPAVMVGVAANLITIFLHPEGRNNDKSTQH